MALFGKGERARVTGGRLWGVGPGDRKRDLQRSRRSRPRAADHFGQCERGHEEGDLTSLRTRSSLLI